MNRHRLLFAIFALLLLFTVATVQADDQAELAEVRAATAPFHQPGVAAVAGWDLIVSPCVANPGVGAMGYHHLNGALVDLVIEATKPELLVYAPGPHGQLQLVAVEYMVPAGPWDAANSSQPTALGQTMHYNPVLDAYTLHAWLWRHNPAGMFAEWNPDVSCS